MKSRKLKSKVTRSLITVIFTLFLIYITRDVEDLIPSRFEKPFIEDFYSNSTKYQEYEHQSFLLNLQVKKWENRIDSFEYEDREYSLLSDSIFAYDSLYNNLLDKKTELAKATIIPEYNNAFWNYELKIFFIRFSVTVSILVLSISLFVRFRRHRLAPFFAGFMWFVIFSFIIRCLVFVPIYGEEIRYELNFSAFVTRYYR